ncbi:hypothetical protein SAMN05216390_1314, partial [Lachnospiraceae bacterium KH1T2]
MSSDENYLDKLLKGLDGAENSEKKKETEEMGVLSSEEISAPQENFENGIKNLDDNHVYTSEEIEAMLDEPLNQEPVMLIPPGTEPILGDISEEDSSAPLMEAEPALEDEVPVMEAEPTLEGEASVMEEESTLEDEVPVMEEEPALEDEAPVMEAE